MTRSLNLFVMSNDNNFITVGTYSKRNIAARYLIKTEDRNKYVHVKSLTNGKSPIPTWYLEISLKFSCNQKETLFFLKYKLFHLISW